MVVKNKKISLEIINESRTILLGIATFIVALFHSFSLNFYVLINFKPLANILNLIQKTGNYGVDIFLFLSGIGLYFSLSKNNILKFYKNRFIRIIPELIIVLLIYNLITKSLTPIEFLETAFFIGFFFKGDISIWFIPFIMFLYFIFPLIYKIIKKYDIYGLAVSLFLTVIFNLLYLFIFPINYGNIEIALTRIPIFLIGTYFGKLIYEKKEISKKGIVLSFILEILLFTVLYTILDANKFNIISRYIYCPLAITTVINISIIYSLIKNKNNLIIKPLKFLGIHSLEIYLIYEKTCQILGSLLSINSYSTFYLICFSITLVISYILKLIVNIAIKQINNLYSKKQTKNNHQHVCK